MKNIYPAKCPYCGLKSLFTHKDVVTKIDYYNIFENWIEWSIYVYCPFCETPIILGGGGNKFWSLFTFKYFFKKLFNKTVKF